MTTTQKGGSLTGGALTAEAIASSRSIFHTTRGGKTQGLQQFWCPAHIAEFIKNVVDPRGRLRVFDPTAGNGSLLAPHRRRFGAELDADQIRAAKAVEIERGHPAYADCQKAKREAAAEAIRRGEEPDLTSLVGPYYLDQSYNALHGDIQRLYPLLRLSGLRFSCIVANPPFGEKWTIKSLNDGKEGSSTRITWEICQQLVSDGGQGAFICGTRRLQDEILSDPEAAKAIYYILDYEDMFPGVDLPCSIAFWGDPKKRTNAPYTERKQWEEFSASFSTEAIVSTIINRRKAEFKPRWGSAALEETDHYDGYQLDSVNVTGKHFSDIQMEHTKRLKHEEGKGTYDLELHGSKLQVRISPLAVSALDNSDHRTAGEIRFLQDLNGQRANYFALNQRDWKRVRGLIEEGIVTMHPKDVQRVEEIVEDSRRVVCPVYEIEPQQRLAYLEDLDNIVCITSDDERGFVAGQSYPLTVNTEIQTESRVEDGTDRKTGETQKNHFKVDRKVLRITIGSKQKFSETKDDIEYLLAHFQIPDPGDVSTRFPEQIDYYREAVYGAVEKFGRNGFNPKHYQAEDIARLLFKKGGLLSWEQGLGKCVMPHTLVVVNNTLMRIEDVWEKYAGPNRMQDTDNGEWTQAQPYNGDEPLTVQSISEAGQMHPLPVGQLYRQRVSEIVRRVTLDDGSSIEITKAHKLYNGTDWTNLFTPGDTICVPSRLAHGTESIDRDLVTAFAWQLTEGSESGNRVKITQKDREVLRHIKRAFSNLSATYGMSHARLEITDTINRNCPDLYAVSPEYKAYAVKNGYPWATKSAERRIPDTLMRGDKESIRLLLQIFFEAEGGVYDNKLAEFTSASYMMAEQTRHLLRRFGVWARLHKKRKCATNGRRIYRDYYTLGISGPDLRTFAQEIGFISERKSLKLYKAISGPENGNRNGVPGITPVVHNASRRLGAPLKHLACRGTSFKTNYTRNSATAILDRLATYEHPAARDAETEINRLCSQEVHYAKVVSVEEFQYDGYVYDLEVPGDHNFVANGMLAHNTAGSMLFALTSEFLGETDGNALFIAPQDLIPQWKREAEKFFGRELTLISSRTQARRIAQEIKRKERKPGWYITYYEAIATNEIRFNSVNRLHSIVDSQFIPAKRDVTCSRGRAIMPHEVVKWQIYDKRVEIAPSPDSINEDDDPFNESAPQYAQHRIVKSRKASTTTAEQCPRCHASEAHGDWDGYHCKRCGETRALLVQKPMAKELTTAFKQGIIIVDEGTKIKGDDSLTSLAVRGLRARRKLLLTGTPVKNYVNDLFHLLGWSLGWASPRFPFAYGREGKSKFEKDFCVIETRNFKYKKTLPEVTNLSVLWRLLSGSIVRRRKEDAGENIVERTFVPITVPMGTYQFKQYECWLDGFVQWYCEQHPGADPEEVERSAAVLGQLHKLEYATTMPLADPDAAYWNLPISNMTPKNLKILQIAQQHVEAGEKVLIGSDVKAAGQWLAERLQEKGVKAIHMLDRGGDTLPPAKRATLVHGFTHGDDQVLCASEQSMNLGHNLDCASVVILDGFCWDFATLDQFLARVHRLTSQKPVTVYVVIADGSLDERKWQLLQDKGASSELALDGHLIDKKEAPISMQEILDELRRKGVAGEENTISELATQRAWDTGQSLELRKPVAALVDTVKETANDLILAFPPEETPTRPREPRWSTVSMFDRTEYEPLGGVFA